MRREGLLTVGSVVGVHGLKGGLKIRHDCETDALLGPGRQLYLLPPRHTTASGYDVTAFHATFRGGVLHLEGVGDRAAAAALVGAELQVPRAALPPIEEQGTYYWADLIGLTVVTEQRRALGQLTAIMPTGGTDVYVVRDAASGQERLLPALASVVLEIDLEAGQMIVSPPEGLE
jgi:16S rRNA processing protein RimM